MGPCCITLLKERVSYRQLSRPLHYFLTTGKFHLLRAMPPLPSAVVAPYMDFKLSSIPISISIPGTLPPPYTRLYWPDSFLFPSATCFRLSIYRAGCGN
ncbi:hypothetical protein Ddc_06019 [Ditylenchus destructor]|nr:hypothetical protein Ddc_06019 [Ditylenchus destructor]